jgi:exopolyphosphatase/guanosine-5'-triphosphate,3'-diphosphate pyrophosphatase
LATKKPPFAEIAAVDLGSNSFRLQLARLDDGHLLLQDSLREAVRLGAGLGKDKSLDAATQTRAIECLERFGERLRGFPPQAVRAVATNTFRVAKNSTQLLKQAQAALGFPIEIISGREEARMIFVGVSHSLPPVSHKRLVIDIGGGSTEFIIGTGVQPQKMESLYMGCVSYSMRFFPDGKISANNLDKAKIAAATEIQNIRKQFSGSHWQEVIGSSGTARALAEVIRLNGLDAASDGAITGEGLAQLCQLLVKAKDSRKLQLEGLSADRAAVLPGGFAIMAAAFDELGIERMMTVSTALREGVLYELVGRMQHDDTREATVRSFMRRYHVDREQAGKVQKLALRLLSQISDTLDMEHDIAKQYLVWAAKLHEIGISIAHNGFHRHSAYIIENADMSGFSTMEQATLGLLLRAQRRSLSKANLQVDDDRCALVLILRLAILFHRNRLADSTVQLQLSRDKHGFDLRLQPDWLEDNPLTAAELENETAYWEEIGVRFGFST